MTFALILLSALFSCCSVADTQSLLPPTYLPTATSALAGVISQIASDGEVSQVSFGTGMGRNLQFYHDIPITSMPYGQALAMLAIVEWERLELGGK